MVKIHMNLWFLSDVGEDTIAYSDTSSYAANIEMAPVVTQYEKSNEEAKELEKVLTENQKTIADVSSFLNVQEQQCIKSLLI